MDKQTEKDREGVLKVWKDLAHRSLHECFQVFAFLYRTGKCTVELVMYNECGM